MSRYCLTMGWQDIPHLSPRQKAEMLAALPPHQREARSKGIPQLGAGAIYPLEESTVVVPERELPPHWPRCFALDVGWNRTAALWGAWDREADVVYLYAEHYLGEAQPAIHAAGIKGKGAWIPGVIDPASRGRAQNDGIQLLQIYTELGLDLEMANNAVEAGIYEVWTRLSTGRLKVFQGLTSWLREFRIYRRDEKGRIVKENDHLMDCCRYLILSGLARARTKPAAQAQAPTYDLSGGSGLGWMR